MTKSASLKTDDFNPAGGGPQSSSLGTAARPYFPDGAVKITIRLPLDTYNPICERAESLGKKVSRYCRDLVLADLTESIRREHAMRRQFAALVAAPPGTIDGARHP